MNDKMDLLLTGFMYLSPFLLMGLVWLGKRLDGWLGSMTKNELIKGVMIRFKDSVLDGVKRVNQTLKSEIMAAKAPGSPGGTKITEEEAKGLKEAVWEDLKDEYGGMDGIQKALKVLGLGDASWMKWVDGKIEAAVSDAKLSEKAVAGPQ